MGNYRFRLSDMMPNAWFYKLKDMSSKVKSHGNTGKKQHSSASTKQPHHHHFYPRKSYYFTRQLVPTDDGFYVSSHTRSTKSPASHNLLVDPAPRRSSRKRPGKRNIGSSVPAACRFHAKAESPMRYSASSASSDDGSSSPQQLRSDCILSTTQSSEVRDVKTFDNLFELQLPRIITKPVKFNYTEKDTRKKTSPGRKFGPNSPGVRLRLNSPKIGSRRIQGHARKSVSSSSSSSSRKSLSDSFAVVKSSLDPQRDFRESMVEMIMENNIRASKDLEDLLACYLSLNSDEYHHLIIKVFKQIWFDMNDIRLK